MTGMQPARDVSDTFALAMVALAEAYGTKLTETRIRLYFEALGDVPQPALDAAMRQAVREIRFFPSAAELRALCTGSTDDRALLAWSALQRAAQVVGAWSSLEVEDVAAGEALVRVFGTWPAYCAQEGPALGARKPEFLAAYREALRRASRLETSTRLLGLCEAGGATGTSGGARLWRGRITSGGDVRMEVDRPALAAAAPPALGD